MHTDILQPVAYLFLHTVPCEVNEFECANGYGCLDNTQVCDDLQLCLDASDELNCTGW